MLKFTIPIAPRTKKNNQEIHWRQTPKGKIPYIAQGKVYREYEQDCLRVITGQFREQIDCPVNVKATYYVDTEGVVDITNLHSAMCDVLVAAGVLKDDNRKIVESLDGSRVKVDRENPRTEIEIIPAENRKIPRRTDAEAGLIRCAGCEEVRCDRDDGICPVLSDVIKTLWRYEQAQESGALVWVGEPPEDPRKLPAPERLNYFYAID